MACLQAESQEFINGLHLITLMEKTDEVLRNKFHQYFPTDPTDLYSEITKHERKLKTFLKENIITRSQYNILLPSTGNTDSSKCNTFLLTFSLRVLCPITAPITGWETLPLQSDHSEGSCLVRIHIERKSLLQHNLQYKNKVYEDVWDRIASAFVGLGCDKQALVDLKSTSLDPIPQVNYERKIRDLKIILKRVTDLEDSLTGIAYNLNLSVPSFAGRERELSEIHQKLLERDVSQLGMVIHGHGGIGKSELARQYCQRYAASLYKRNVIWINAENTSTMTNDFFNVAEKIKLKISDENNKQLSCKAVVTKVYKYFADRPVLFVFDNVIDKNEFMEFMEHDISPNISVLITSRYIEWDEKFIQTRINVLSKEAAFELVSQQLTGKDIMSDENVNSLCKTLQLVQSN